jgi:glycosyltransferase involved in cell wall biosynthesis
LEISSPKILILSAYDVGGASIAAIRLHLGLLKLGVNSKLLTLHKSSSNIPEHYQFQPSSNWKEKVYLKLRQRNEHKQKTSLELFDNTSLSGEFSMPIASYDITNSPLWDWADVVNLHWVNEWISLENLLAKAGKKKIVWTMHDMHLFTGGCHYSHGCEGFKLECKDCPMLQKSNMPQLANQFWKVKTNALKLNKPFLTITSPSSWMAGLVGSSSLLRDFKSMAIPNSLDTNIFKPAPKKQSRQALNLPTEKIILLTVIQSLKDKRKGFQLLLDSLIYLPEPERFVLLTVGGLNKDIPLHKIEHIHLGSLVDERLMAMVYNSADILVHPAVEDNLPNVVVESICCGVPVVGFNIGGMSEMVSNGLNGFLSDITKPEVLAQSIVSVLESNLNKVEISQAAHAKFALELQAKNFQKLFENILS